MGTSNSYLFKAYCVARELATITCVLPEAQQQAEEWTTL